MKHIQYRYDKNILNKIKTADSCKLGNYIEYTNKTLRKSKLIKIETSGTDYLRLFFFYVGFKISCGNM